MTTDKTHPVRAADRVQTILPVSINGIKGITRDISSSGIFLEVESPIEPGKIVEFLVTLDSPSGDLVLSCQGEVVRSEEFEKSYGIATKILSLELLPLLNTEGS
ncbi:PilZ domain-containing protein [Polynucleobacter sp. UB-Tiil-W10]|uniref:PilZ domain-containing protein n=1 Tax=Polynucleobacter sp. UB-Tiil-W10 TaxID=1855648 RepID=UPI001C0E668E|nr:PilZ domain-containing protein [Polynucleobacter sp. UB-Tiil-W10]MBU3541628.1 PilZ domain-containing protein [Polynucleobacter sp. UB-Tiil-W10]